VIQKCWYVSCIQQHGSGETFNGLIFILLFLFTHGLKCHNIFKQMVVSNTWIDWCDSWTLEIYEFEQTLFYNFQSLKLYCLINFNIGKGNTKMPQNIDGNNLLYETIESCSSLIFYVTFEELTNVFAFILFSSIF
jgi:hypothetical protein